MYLRHVPCMKIVSFFVSSFLMILGFPDSSVGKKKKKIACNAGDLCSVPGSGRSPGEGKGYLLQYSGLKNSMDHKVHGVTESNTTE